MVHRRTTFPGNLKVLRILRIATIPLCQNFRGKQLALSTRDHGNALLLNKAIHLGDR